MNKHMKPRAIIHSTLWDKSWLEWWDHLWLWLQTQQSCVEQSDSYKVDLQKLISPSNCDCYYDLHLQTKQQEGSVKGCADWVDSTARTNVWDTNKEENLVQLCQQKPCALCPPIVITTELRGSMETDTGGGDITLLDPCHRGNSS